MKYKSVLSMVAVVAAMTMGSSVASAEDVSLSVGGGAAEVMDTNNAGNLFTHNAFQLGDTGVSKLMFKLTPNLAVGPEASGMYMQDAASTNQAGVLWTFAGAVKLQGNHSAGWYPYVDVGFGASVEDHIWNPALLSHAGLQFALEDTHTFWLGPYVGYNHTWDVASSQPQLLQHHDLNLAAAGVELAFDFPVAQKKVVQTTWVPVEVDVPGPVMVVEAPTKPCPPAVAPTHTTKLANTTVFFQKNSASLDQKATATLNDIAKSMADDKSFSVVVEGRASSDGNSAYNKALSAKRATATVNYLTSQGVDASRLSVQSLGAVGTSGDKNNRSVVFIVLQ